MKEEDGVISGPSAFSHRCQDRQRITGFKVWFHSSPLTGGWGQSGTSTSMEKESEVKLSAEA